MEGSEAEEAAKSRPENLPGHPRETHVYPAGQPPLGAVHSGHLVQCGCWEDDGGAREAGAGEQSLAPLFSPALLTYFKGPHVLFRSTC